MLSLAVLVRLYLLARRVTKMCHVFQTFLNGFASCPCEKYLRGIRQFRMRPLINVGRLHSGGGSANFALTGSKTTAALPQILVAFHLSSSIRWSLTSPLNNLLLLRFSRIAVSLPSLFIHSPPFIIHKPANFPLAMYHRNPGPNCFVES